jgi:hypothetical protein
MTRERYAKAKMLAQLPTEAITERDLDLLDEIIRRLQTTEDGTVGTLIGDPYQGQQMAMRLNPVQISGPSSVRQAANFGVRTPVKSSEEALTQLEQLALDGNAPRQMMGVDFGWVPEGNMRGDMVYTRELTTPEAREHQKQQRYAQQLKAALPQLMEQAGMRPGDVLYNNPVGTLNGDYTRAKGYLRYGFGAPTADNEQFARLDAMGRPVAIQPFNADAGLVRSMGWTPAPNADADRQAQLEAAFRRRLAEEQEYYPPGY